MGVNPGKNKLRIVVTAEDEHTNKPFTLRVNRGQPNKNAKLKNLELKYKDGGADTDVPLAQAFQNNVYDHTASVPYSVDQVTVSGTPEDPDAMVDYLDDNDATITDADGIEEGRQVALDVGPNTIKVKVTAEDGNTILTYTVVVIRTAASTDATLRSLALTYNDAGTDTALSLTPGFESAAYYYTASVDYEIGQASIIATKNDDDATVRYLDEDDNMAADADSLKEGYRPPWTSARTPSM